MNSQTVKDMTRAEETETLEISWSGDLSLGETFNKYRKEGLFTDVTLVSSDGVESKAHKAILSYHSRFLKNLFKVMNV